MFVADTNWAFNPPSMFVHTCDMLTWEQEVKEQMYAKIAKVSESHEGSMRLSGLFVGLASGVLTLAFRVASIGEIIIKGLANIFGAILGLFGTPDCEDFNFFTGLKQIFVGLPGSILNGGLWAPIEILIVDIGANSIQMLINPVQWPEERSGAYSFRKEEWREIATPGHVFRKGENRLKTLQVFYGP